MKVTKKNKAADSGRAFADQIEKRAYEFMAKDGVDYVSATRRAFEERLSVERSAVNALQCRGCGYTTPMSFGAKRCRMCDRSLADAMGVDAGDIDPNFAKHTNRPHPMSGVHVGGHATPEGLDDAEAEGLGDDVTADDAAANACDMCAAPLAEDDAGNLSFAGEDDGTASLRCPRCGGPVKHVSADDVDVEADDEATALGASMVNPAPTPSLPSDPVVVQGDESFGDAAALENLAKKHGTMPSRDKHGAPVNLSEHFARALREQRRRRLNPEEPEI